MVSIPCAHNVSILPLLGNSDHNIVSFQLKAPTAVTIHVPLPNFNKLGILCCRSISFLSNGGREFIRNYTSIENVYKRLGQVICSGLAVHVPFFDKDGIKLHYPGIFQIC